jgi:hypothetical protein
MKNSMTTVENDSEIIISIVIPSVNESNAKLLILTGVEYSKLKKVAESNKGKDKQIFAICTESFDYLDLLNSGMVGLTKEQFDELLKEKYNTEKNLGRFSKYLKKIK